MGKLSEWIEKQYGVKTRSIENPVTDLIGTTAAIVIRQNPDRFAWLLVNLSANTVYVAFTPDVSSSKGIRLAANGGSVTFLAEEDLELVTREAWAVATAANSAIYVLEIEAV